ncbi:hypothetical protein A2911_00260 [Candidatus Nomurabacteria bacterium RIFCSPLOWO2_01_FULL_40_15]|uniref:Uncharacterized protein n=1 Tax=Candidatus Nomurabacteria bacterium RIFCSPLOWO2_01_FULL_40_15 TaxID=1801772 RepID=A0A1F6X8K3_9BACT|nr:MAG: hypothetical protein A2911_00260 [Candidatus Nomurabacteria bacterium RIFCSPLOWO2_01_FULL_40_15]
MKKLIVLIILAAAALFFFLFLRGDSKKTINDITLNQNESFRPDPSNATFSDIDGEATILPERAYGDVNGDEKIDAIVLLAESGGGSGVFIYAAAYVSGLVNYKGTNAVFIGDRIAPQSVSVSSNGVVTVKYLDRKEDEPFAAEPTVPASKQFVFKNGELVER